MPEITAAMVKELRDATGAGMMDCKRALIEADGDVARATEILREKGLASQAKRAGRSANQGLVDAYIHFNNTVGVLVEVNCETDFVARGDEFNEFARDVALHVAGSPEVAFVSDEDVPDDAKQAELRVFEQQAADKPEDIRPKIAEGKLNAWLDDVVLLRQKHVNVDKHEEKTIEELRAELSAKTGENIVVRRFARFVVGEE
jgi:elongation factor Ts